MLGKYLFLLVILVMISSLSACGPETISNQEPTQPVSEESGSASIPIMDESKRPLLSDALIRNCGRSGFGRQGLIEGDTAIEFTLKDIHGNRVSLSEILIEKPVVMIFGSFT